MHALISTYICGYWHCYHVTSFYTTTVRIDDLSIMRGHPRNTSSLAVNRVYFSIVYSIKYAYGSHDDVIKWKHFPRYWTFVRGIHWLPVNSPHKGQWHKPLSKQSWCWWFETPSRSLWRHCNVMWQECSYITRYLTKTKHSKHRTWAKYLGPILLTWFNFNPSVDK